MCALSIQDHPTNYLAVSTTISATRQSGSSATAIRVVRLDCILCCRHLLPRFGHLGVSFALRLCEGSGALWNTFPWFQRDNMEKVARIAKSHALYGQSVGTTRDVIDHSKSVVTGSRIRRWKFNSAVECHRRPSIS